MSANKRVEIVDKAPVVAGIEAGDHKMDQIRELMFGSVVRDFDRRIQEVSERM